MIRKALQKLHNRKGVTIGEVLVCCLILVLASGILVTGVTFAATYFEKTFTASQSQLIESTLTAAINDELRYTSHVWVTRESDGTCTLDGYYSKNFGADEGDVKSTITVIDDNGQEHSMADLFDNSDNVKAVGRVQVAGKELVPSTVYSHGCMAAVNIVPTVSKKQDGTWKLDYFTVTLIVKKSTASSASEPVTFMIIPINSPTVAVTEN